MMNSEERMQQILALAEGLVLQEKTNRPAISVPLTHWPKVAETLRHDVRFEYDMLLDHAAVDWPAKPASGEGSQLFNGKIELSYQLYSTKQNSNLMVCVDLSREQAIAPSVHHLWPIAEWQEREVYDLFGVKYSGHPDLRRLFLEDDWKGFPLLKDYKDDFILEKPW